MSLWIPFSAVAVVALLLAERAQKRSAIAIAKMTAAGCFLAFAVACGAFESDYGQTLLVGLALCALGDALLLPPGQTLWFQLGIGAFLLGHVSYAIAFLRLGPDVLALALSAIALTLFASRVLVWLRPHVPGEFKTAVVAYVIVISAMAAVALASVAAGAPAGVAIGALLFAASDISVARERFVEAGFTNSVWGLPAYFGSQMILAGTTASALN
jgi:uncharacterized membrane protein YhhN